MPNLIATNAAFIDMIIMIKIDWNYPGTEFLLFLNISSLEDMLKLNDTWIMEQILLFKIGYYSSTKTSNVMK